MNVLVAPVLLSLCFIVAGQTHPATQKPLAATKKISAKDRLMKALIASKRQGSVSIRIDATIQSKAFVSIFEYVSPDRYYLYETVNGEPLKEAIEISGQRYQRARDKTWVKVRKDPAPLREQLENVFPILLSSKKADVIKIKVATVTELEDAILVDKKYSRYKYAISFRDLDWLDTGVAWVNQSTGLIERLETNSRALFGPATGTWTYDYQKVITISAPTVYIVKDWID